MRIIYPNSYFCTTASAQCAFELPFPDILRPMFQEHFHCHVWISGNHGDLWTFLSHFVHRVGRALNFFLILRLWKHDKAILIFYSRRAPLPQLISQSYDVKELFNQHTILLIKRPHKSWGQVSSFHKCRNKYLE